MRLQKRNGIKMVLRDTKMDMATEYFEEVINPYHEKNYDYGKGLVLKNGMSLFWNILIKIRLNQFLSILVVVGMVVQTLVF